MVNINVFIIILIESLNVFAIILNTYEKKCNINVASYVKDDIISTLSFGIKVL